VLAVHHRRSGLFAKLFNLASRNIFHSSAHLEPQNLGFKVSRFRRKAGSVGKPIMRTIQGRNPETLQPRNLRFG
jgi:hypothetical protein